MTWALLAEKYAESGIVLALGAGVSARSGLPNWMQLLERIASQLAPPGRAKDCEQLVKHGFGLPTIASILEEYSGGREAFVERARAALYQEFPFFPEGVSKSNRRDFVGQIRTGNPTLHAVATLCAVPAAEGATRRYAPNPRIRGVVTFNLDALLQAYVYARFEKRLLRTIERASATSSAHKINVYHMHGFLRFDLKAGDRSKEAPDCVILTEQDYFNFFNDPTSLFNYTFLYLLREAPCLFVGMSMQDENIRRMLHLSRQERVKALMSEGVSPAEAGNRALRHFAVLRRGDVPSNDEAMAHSLARLGARVLWVDRWDEIPERLCSLYESTADRWDLVQ